MPIFSYFTSTCTWCCSWLTPTPIIRPTVLTAVIKTETYPFTLNFAGASFSSDYSVRILFGDGSRNLLQFLSIHWISTIIRMLHYKKLFSPLKSICLEWIYPTSNVQLLQFSHISIGHLSLFLILNENKQYSYKLIIVEVGDQFTLLVFISRGRLLEPYLSRRLHGNVRSTYLIS